MQSNRKTASQDFVSSTKNQRRRATAYIQSQDLKTTKLDEENARLYLPSYKEERKYKFLVSYHRHRTITPACLEAGVSYGVYRKWLKEDPLFRHGCEIIQDTIVQALERAGLKRALRSSDSLLMFFLRANRPSVYKEIVRNEHTGKDGNPIQTRNVNGNIDLSSLDEKTLKKLADLADQLNLDAPTT